MSSFNNIVADILFEQPQQAPAQTAQQAPAPATQKPPQWLQRIITKHNQLGLGNIDDQTYLKAVNVAFRPNQNRLADKELESVYDAARIVDVIEQYKEATKNAKTFDNKILYSTDPEYLKAGDAIASRIEQITSSDNWKPETPIVSSVYYKLQDTYDKMGAVALATFDSKSILETVVEIVKRRTNIFDRISNLKSPTQPFANLIVDIFRYPDEYMSGQKKVSSDFSRIVDNLYVTNLFQIGKATKDFYATQITKLKTDPAERQQRSKEQIKQDVLANVGKTRAGSQSSKFSQWAQGPGSKPSSSSEWTGVRGTTTATGPGRTTTTYDSLNYFEWLVNSILISEASVVQTLKQGAQNIGSNIKTAAQAVSTAENRQLFMQIFNKVRADQSNYNNFIQNKPVEFKVIDPSTGKDTGEIGTTDPNAYTIGEIKKMESPEARTLIKALESIAQYTRKGVGAGQVARGLTKLRVGMGPVG